MRLRTGLQASRRPLHEDAGQTIMLAAKAKAMGHDSCPMLGFDPVKLAEIIHLPSDHVIGFMIPVGTPTQARGVSFPLADACRSAVGGPILRIARGLCR
ncbi:MAG: nitroreductase family protein [Pirellulales bacterium]